MNQVVVIILDRGPAHHSRRHSFQRTIRHIEQSYALWAKQKLVSARSERVHIISFHIQLQRSQALHSVHDMENLAISAILADPPYIESLPSAELNPAHRHETSALVNQ